MLEDGRRDGAVSQEARLGTTCTACWTTARSAACCACCGGARRSRAARSQEEQAFDRLADAVEDSLTCSCWTGSSGCEPRDGGVGTWSSSRARWRRPLPGVVPHRHDVRIEVSCADGAGSPCRRDEQDQAGSRSRWPTGVRVDGRVAVRRVESLPEGKGYASSTADILGALYGLARLSGAELEPGEATRIALEVEPTDSIAWPGLALLDHRGGRRSELLGAPPPMAVLVIDEGGSVDTEEFNRADRAEILSSQARTHEEAFSALADGLRRGDPAAVGEAATESAKACGLILAKPWLDRCLSLCRSLGGYGVCTAHSGTLYGVLLPVSLLVDRAAVLEAASTSSAGR